MTIINMSRNNGSDKRVSRVTVATSVNSRWKSRDCDFLCDGIDDNVEINNAIQSLPEDGGEIVILDGTYNISSSILLNKNNTKISGNGKSTKFVRGWDSSSEEGIINISAVDGGCTIENIYLDGNSGTYGNTNNAGIFTSTDNNKISGNIIGNSSSAILLSGNKEIVTDNHIFDSDIGINLSGSNSCIVSDNILSNVESKAISLSDSLYNNIISNSCNRGNNTESDYTEIQYSIYLSGSSSNNLITNNMIMGKDVIDTTGNKTNTVIYNKYDDSSSGEASLSFDDLLCAPGTTVTETESEDGESGLVTWTTTISQNEIQVANRVEEEQAEIEGKAKWVTTTTMNGNTTVTTSTETDNGWVTNTVDG